MNKRISKKIQRNNYYACARKNMRESKRDEKKKGERDIESE